MSIEIKIRHRKPRDETRQRVFISISGVNANAFEFEMANIPIELETDEAVLAHLEQKEDFLHLFCLRKTWIGAEISRFQVEGKTELEAFLDWIDDGHRNITGYDEEEEPIYEEIANHPYPGTHPHALEWLEEMEAAVGLEQVKAANIKMIKDMI